MENNITKNDYSKVELSEKDRYVEFLSVSACLLLLLACFFKVLFF